MTATLHSNAGLAMAVESWVQGTIAAFLTHQSVWADHTAQDALESAVRIPWLRQVRRGIRVPVRVLYATGAGRVAQNEVKRFVDAASAEVAATVHIPTGDLQSVGYAAIEKTAPYIPSPDPIIRRVWTEAEVPWRRRFEREVRLQIHMHATQALQHWLESTLHNIVDSWSAVIPPVGSAPRD